LRTTPDNFAGQPLIVMELVEGETLEARLNRGALKLDQALALAISNYGRAGGGPRQRRGASRSQADEHPA
jgi:hypothetical protein